LENFSDCHANNFAPRRDYLRNRRIKLLCLPRKSIAISNPSGTRKCPARFFDANATVNVRLAERHLNFPQSFEHIGFLAGNALAEARRRFNLARH
jgi:hypothetical protein